MREAIVVLAPDMRSEQVVKGCDRTPPLDVASDLQPLRMLIEHRVDDVDESFVAGEESVASGKEIAFQPTLAHVLAQHLENAAVPREIFVDRKNRFQP